jgi:thiol:disulfide interchange protein DsbC
MVSVWCATDRKKALTDAKTDRPVPGKTCTNPISAEYNLGQRVGLEGTPMILSEDGAVLGGYLPPDQLQSSLDKLDAGQTPVASTATGSM